MASVADYYRLAGLAILAGLAFAAVLFFVPGKEAVRRDLDPVAIGNAGGGDVRKDVASPAVHTAVPEDTGVHKLVERELIPLLYASNDIDALITGAILLLDGDAADYTVADFLELGLSLKRDDPLLLAFMVAYCREFGRSIPLCRQVPALQLLANVGGDNAWIWAMRAHNADKGTEARLEYMISIANATYYNDYSIETRILFIHTLQDYGADVEPVMLYGMERLALVADTRTDFQGICGVNQMSADPAYVKGCRRLGEYLMDASTHVGQTLGIALLQDVSDITGTPAPDIPAWLQDDELQALSDLLAADAQARNYYHEKLTRYTEIAAMKQTMIHYGLVEDDGTRPQSIIDN